MVIKFGRVVLGNQQSVLTRCNALKLAEDLCKVALIGKADLVADLCQAEVGF